jgi:hypothetical protein
MLFKQLVVDSSNGLLGVEHSGEIEGDVYMDVR